MRGHRSSEEQLSQTGLSGVECNPHFALLLLLLWLLGLLFELFELFELIHLGTQAGLPLLQVLVFRDGRIGDAHVRVGEGFPVRRCDGDGAECLEKRLVEERVAGSEVRTERDALEPVVGGDAQDCRVVDRRHSE